MEAKAIKVSSENYKWLVRLAANLQGRREKIVSLDEALTSLKQKMTNKELLEYAGIWKDKPESIKEDIRKGWKLWKIKSV